MLARKFLLISALLAVVFTAVLAVNTLRLSWYRIETGSMEPDYPVGTVVIDSGLARPELHKPITFRADGDTVTHILVGYNKDGSLITRGIANGANDIWMTPVHTHDIRGRALLQLLLFAPSFWLSGKGVATAAGLACMAMALYFWRKGRRIESRGRFVVEV